MYAVVGVLILFAIGDLIVGSYDLGKRKKDDLIQKAVGSGTNSCDWFGLLTNHCNQFSLGRQLGSIFRSKQMVKSHYLDY